MDGITQTRKIPLSVNRLKPTQVYMSLEKYDGDEVVRVIKFPTVTEPDEPTFVRINDVDFKDGTIEVKLMSTLLSNAKPTHKGFIGIAFRINEENTRFECIYLRPANSRSPNQVQRNHSTQYFSYPDFKFDRLRKDAPEMYESYADMGLNEWIRVRIKVKGNKAKLYLNKSRQPCLIINDLKHGDNASGAIGLFVDNGTEGYFKDIKIFND